MSAAGDYADPIGAFGADYVYVSIDAGFFPKGAEVEKRGRVEEAVELALKEFDGGRCVGGAFGSQRSYSDFLIFEGQRSLAAIQDALRAENAPPGTMIEFFAREKRGHRIAL